MTYIDPKAEERFFLRQKEMLRRMGCMSPVIFDVGGNVGQSVEEYGRLFASSRIVSFEPLPDCFAELSAKFGDRESIRLERLALGEEPGTAQFFSTNCRPASSLLKPSEIVRAKSPKKNYDYEEIQVKVDSLDAYCEREKESRIDILKIDVQGSEIGVLKGAEKLLSGGAVSLMYLEVLFADNYQGQSDLVGITTLLARHNYVLWDVRPFLYTRAGRLWTANAMFVSSSACKALESFPEDFQEQ